ncbi:MAG: FAD-dependent oxidoreductase, partial [Nanoarchaeota archaeon]
MVDYDLIVIGAGSAGLRIADFMNRAKFKVLLIECCERAIGGNFLNSGAVPCAALMQAASVVHDAKKAQCFGLRLRNSTEVSMQEVRAYIQERQDVRRAYMNSDYLRQHGIDVVLGNAEFVGRHSVAVNGII